MSNEQTEEQVVSKARAHQGPPEMVRPNGVIDSGTVKSLIISRSDDPLEIFIVNDRVAGFDGSRGVRRTKDMLNMGHPEEAFIRRWLEIAGHQQNKSAGY